MLQKRQRTDVQWLDLLSEVRERFPIQPPRNRVAELLQNAGIRIDGDRPFDLQVHEDRLYPKLLVGGSLALGETYMAQWWDCERIDMLVARLLEADLPDQISRIGEVPTVLSATVSNWMQDAADAFEIGEFHYDLGRDLFEEMLGDEMAYSCGIWRDADSLTQAQRHKHDRICRKLDLQPGDRVVDIGCGWGGFAKYAAEEYGARVVGITVSKDQVRYARSRCRGLDAGFRLQDYRDLDETFDHAVSIGMFEHVGPSNYRSFLERVADCLRDSGRFVLQTIGANDSYESIDPWIHRYIFPNAVLPSAAQLGDAMDGLLILEDWENFGPDYDTTLMHWCRRFEEAWPELSRSYDRRFFRMWRYYLQFCAGTFRARHNQAWQILLSKNGIRGELPRVEGRRDTR